MRTTIICHRATSSISGSPRTMRNRTVPDRRHLDVDGGSRGHARRCRAGAAPGRRGRERRDPNRAAGAELNAHALADQRPVPGRELHRYAAGDLEVRGTSGVPGPGVAICTNICDIVRSPAQALISGAKSVDTASSLALKASASAGRYWAASPSISASTARSLARSRVSSSTCRSVSPVQSAPGTGGTAIRMLCGGRHRMERTGR